MKSPQNDVPQHFSRLSRYGGDAPLTCSPCHFAALTACRCWTGPCTRTCSFESWHWRGCYSAEIIKNPKKSLAFTKMNDVLLMMKCFSTRCNERRASGVKDVCQAFTEKPNLGKTCLSGCYKQVERNIKAFPGLIV